jgi:hypothetical protein
MGRGWSFLPRWLRPRSKRPDIDELTRLAIKHGTDKWGPHFYTPIYHQLFGRLRNRPIRLLEIGVGGYNVPDVGGASLAMWAEYFAKGRIVGIDVFEKTLDLGPRVTVLRGSQDDRAFVEQVIRDHGPFDIVIDDGSHVPAQVVASFGILFPSVADGGFYVIEDVQTTYWPEYGGAPDGGETMALARSMFDLLNHAEIRVGNPDWPVPELAKTIKSFRAYHNLLFFEKGDNSEPSNIRPDGDNPHAAKALETMEQELDRSPTPEGMANLAALYLMFNKPFEAFETIEKGLALAPKNLTLLEAASIVAGAVNRLGDMNAFIMRAAALRPRDPGLQAKLTQMQAQPPIA